MDMTQKAWHNHLNKKFHSSSVHMTDIEGEKEVNKLLFIALKNDGISFHLLHSQTCPTQHFF